MDPLLPLLTPYDIDGLTKIRLGRDNDGGYVVANELIGRTDHIVSSESGGDISFEYDFMLLNNHCDTINYDDQVKNKHIDGRVQFKRVRVDGSNAVESITAGLKNVMLKLDIEGSEYDAFRVSLGKFPDLSNVNMAVIELHDITDRNYTKTVGFLSLIEKQMTLFHVHGNVYGKTKEIDGHEIPRVVELTFVNNAFVAGKRISTSPYPVPDLDMCNKLGGEDTPLTYFSSPAE